MADHTGPLLPCRRRRINFTKFNLVKSSSITSSQPHPTIYWLLYLEFTTGTQKQSSDYWCLRLQLSLCHGAIVTLAEKLGHLTSTTSRTLLSCRPASRIIHLIRKPNCFGVETLGLTFRTKCRWRVAGRRECWLSAGPAMGHSKMAFQLRIDTGCQSFRSSPYIC